ncbi:hypothetical protein AJ80_09586 [Polytolypa hystricis UAMH7299]|uniref:Rhodopsin domain-containing protein n=1 Tax=Polytolypa hystricis (strain UAMH7299) TaxID=1447883 RepID=A0A2B7WN90_POLH7|nr:hypothetical protein AJ80_09586 [Polytolypa hystricis UAMH7299]
MGNGFGGRDAPSEAEAKMLEGFYHVAQTWIAVSSAVFVPSFFIFCARVYTRSRPKFRFGVEDWLICAAFTATTADWVILLLSMRFLMGGNKFAIPTESVKRESRIYAIVASLLWAFSIAALKSSLACVFLRFWSTRPWKIFLYGLIGGHTAVAIFSILMQMTRCLPLDLALDGKTEGVTCWNARAFRISMATVGVFNICTDVLFSLLPIIFLRKSGLHFREKVVVSILMGLGLVASGASVARVVQIEKLQLQEAIPSTGLPVAGFSYLEQQLGLMAANIPCLRAHFNQILRRFGLIPSSRTYSQGQYVKQTDGFNSRTSHHLGRVFKPSAAMVTVEAVNNSEERILMPDSSTPGRTNNTIHYTTEIYV